MDIEISFEADHILRAMEAVRRAGETHESLLRAMGETLFKQNAERHLQGVGPDGQPWKPLADGTIGSRIWEKQNKSFREGSTQRGPMHSLKTAREVKAGARPLWRTGEMLSNSFHYQIIGDALHLGFDIDRAIWHHGGTKPYTISPRKAKALAFNGIAVRRVHHPGLPARPLIGFPDVDADLVAEECADYLKIALERARGR